MKFIGIVESLVSTLVNTPGVFSSLTPHLPCFSREAFFPLLSQFVLASMQLTVTTGIVLAFWVLVLRFFPESIFSVDYNIYIYIYMYVLSEMHRDSCPLDSKFM